MEDDTSINDAQSIHKMTHTEKKYPDAQRMKHVRETVAQERGLKKLSQTEFAGMLGVNPSTISHIEAGTTRIQRELARLMEEITGFRQAWLLTGEEPKKLGHRSSVPNVPRPPAGFEGAGEFSFSYVPKVKPRLSAGTGELEPDEGAEDFYSFRRDWLFSKGTISDMRLAEVSGDSMLPTLTDGDLVLFDISKRTPRDGKIMVIGIGELLYIKRVRVLPDNISLVSDNKEVCEPWRIDLENTRFLGQVIWHCGEV